MPETRPVGSRHFNISLKKKNIDIPVEANFSEKFQKWLIGDRINTEAIEIEDF
jgi:hypothetical protein